MTTFKCDVKGCGAECTMPDQAALAAGWRQIQNWVHHEGRQWAWIARMCPAHPLPEMTLEAQGTLNVYQPHHVV